MTKGVSAYRPVIWDQTPSALLAPTLITQPSTVALSDATSPTVLTASASMEPERFYVAGNGGNDTLYAAAALTGSGCWWPGCDDLSLVGSLTGSVVSGNLGNDTMKFDEVIKSSSIYGGGGFVYDTSLTVLIPFSWKSLSASLVQANGGNDSMYLSGISKTAPFTAWVLI